MVVWIVEKESWLFLNLPCQSIFRSGRREFPELKKLRKPGAAHLWRSIRLNRKRSFLLLFYFDAHQEQTLQDRTSTMNGFVSDSASDSRASETEAAYTDGHLKAGSGSGNAPAAEADEDLADFNFETPPTTLLPVRNPE